MKNLPIMIYKGNDSKILETFPNRAFYISECSISSMVTGDLEIKGHEFRNLDNLRRVYYDEITAKIPGLIAPGGISFKLDDFLTEDEYKLFIIKGML